MYKNRSNDFDFKRFLHLHNMCLPFASTFFVEKTLSFYIKSMYNIWKQKIFKMQNEREKEY